MSMYVDVRTTSNMGPNIAVCNARLQYGTARDDPYDSVSTCFGRTVTTTLDAMLPVDEMSENDHDVSDYIQRSEEARQLARRRIHERQKVYTHRYNLRRRGPVCTGRQSLVVGSRTCTWPVRKAASPQFWSVQSCSTDRFAELRSCSGGTRNCIRMAASHRNRACRKNQTLL